MDEQNRVEDIAPQQELPPQEPKPEEAPAEKAKALLAKAGEGLRGAGQKAKQLGQKATASLRAATEKQEVAEPAPQAEEAAPVPPTPVEAVPAAEPAEAKPPEAEAPEPVDKPEQPDEEPKEAAPEAPKNEEPEAGQAAAETKIIKAQQGRRAKKKAKKKAQQTAVLAAAKTEVFAPAEEATNKPAAEAPAEADADSAPIGPTAAAIIVSQLEAGGPDIEAEPADVNEGPLGTEPPSGPKPKKKKRRGRKKAGPLRVFGRMVLNGFKFVFVLVCMGLIAACVVAVGVVNYMVSATANDAELLDLESIALSQTSYIYVQDPDSGEWYEYQELISASEHRIWVDYSEIPDYLVQAIVATEDREFYEHHGVSLTRTVYAAFNEVFEMRSTFGASTIDQQVVKNLTGDDDVDYLRKLREMFRAWGLNNRYSKDMIMEVYLNTIGLSEKIVGVQAGSRMYFNKDVSELNLWECATIAGITQAPTYYSPIQNPENCIKRRDDVLTFMRRDEYITEEEYRHALAQPLGLDLTEQEQVNDSVFSYFADQVFNDVMHDLMEQKGYTQSEAYNYIYTGGLRIYCTMDPNLQQVMEDLYYHAYDEDGYLTTFRNGKTGRYYKNDLTMTVDVKDAEGNVVSTYEQLPQSAAVSVRYDGSLAAVVGGIGEKDTSLTLNRATQSVRQVGSTMKPIGAYALGIDLGFINWGSMYNDSPSQYSDKNKTSGEFDWPKNATQTYRRYNVPVATAVAESLNTVAVRVGTYVGVREIYEFLVDTLQITSLEESDIAIAPMALGALTNGISPYEMAGAYTIFGGEDSYGVYNSLHSYYYVEDSRGSIVLKPNVQQLQAISNESGFIMNRLLSGVFGDNTLPGNGSPTARGMKPSGTMDAVAKTGTTNNDSDRWFVGLTPYYVTAIWWGYDVNPENPATNKIYRNWTRSASGNVPPNIWKTLMENAQENLEHKDFPEQPETVAYRSYCTVSGMAPGAGCPTAMGYFLVDDPLMETCNGHSGVVNSHLRPEEGEE